MTLISCERYPTYRQHVRRLTVARPPNYGGHVGIVRALCGARVAWDTKVPPISIDGDIDGCELCSVVYERGRLRMTCCVCSRPDDNMLLVTTYSGPQPICPACGPRFAGFTYPLGEMPSPPPLEVLELWGVP